MANEADMESWTDLLHSSTKLQEQAAPSYFPPLQRNLDQLEALSQKLKEKTLRTEASLHSIIATRLLTRKGINGEQFACDIKSSKLKTTFEDVFPSKETSIGEDLQQGSSRQATTEEEEVEEVGLVRKLRGSGLSESQAESIDVGPQGEVREELLEPLDGGGGGVVSDVLAGEGQSTLAREVEKEIEREISTDVDLIVPRHLGEGEDDKGEEPKEEDDLEDEGVEIDAPEGKALEVAAGENQGILLVSSDIDDDRDDATLAAILQQKKKDQSESSIPVIDKGKAPMDQSQVASVEEVSVTLTPRLTVAGVEEVSVTLTPRLTVAGVEEVSVTLTPHPTVAGVEEVSVTLTPRPTVQVRNGSVQVSLTTSRLHLGGRCRRDPKLDDMEQVEGFWVKKTKVPLVKAIYAKYGNITKDCKLLSFTLKNQCMNYLVSIVEVLQTKKLESLSGEDIDMIEDGLKDLARNGFRVDWLDARVAHFRPLFKFLDIHMELQDMEVDLKDLREQRWALEARITNLEEKQELLKSQLVATRAQVLDGLDIDAVIALDII